MTIYCNRCGLASSEDAPFCQGCGMPFGPPTPVSPLASTNPASSRYAGFWVRVLAALLDTCLLFAVVIPVRALIGSAVTILTLNAQMPMHEMSMMRRGVRIALGVVIAWLYKAGMESSPYEGTLGKMAMRLRVTDLEGRRISFQRATGRYFAKYLSSIVLGIGYLMVGFTERKQGLHDRLAGTLVQSRDHLPR